MNYLKYPLKVPKAFVLLSLMIITKNKFYFHKTHSCSLLLASSSHNFDTSDVKIFLSISGNRHHIYLWPVVVIAQGRENLEIWKETLDGHCHVSDHLNNSVC